MIPELSSNLLLPLVVVIAMFSIDWRMGLALLVTIPVALIPMASGCAPITRTTPPTWRPTPM